MSRNPDQNQRTGAFSDEIVFVEHGMEHAFKHEGGDFGPDREGRFLRLNFVSLYVTDQERSKRFFVEQLGFRAMVDVKFPSGYRWIEVAPPDGTARLALVVRAPGFMDFVAPGRSSLITFMAEDVEARYREWSERGVKFPTAPYTPEWGGKFCRFQDPDGNLFGLSGFNGVTLAIEKRREAEARRREAERLAAQELEIAKLVQMRLFPQRQSAVEGLDYAGVCIQARSVGGDYYDFLDLAEGRVAFVLADIAGKGMAAALLMANLQANMRSQIVTAVDKPEQFLSSVNRLLFENTVLSSYATLFFAVYDNTTCRVLYANCGHLPGLILRSDGAVEKLEATSTVIGLFEAWSCSMRETCLAPGETLVVHSDGVTESPDAAGEEFGEERLLDALRRHRTKGACAMAQAVVKDVENFSTGQQFDDITLIIAKRICRA